MQLLSSAAIGFVFGLGILISGMGNPAKVLNFFDIAGRWDPSLAFVMGGALAVTMPGYWLVFKRGATVSGTAFQLPTATGIDTPLLAGAAVFGIGWGLAGFCPGGLIPVLGIGRSEPLIFLAALIAGLVAARLIRAKLADAVPAFANTTSSPAQQQSGATMTTFANPSAFASPLVDMTLQPEVTAFFDKDTNTISYVVKDPASPSCAIIDSVMDIDYAAGRISYRAADLIIEHVLKHSLKVEWLIETHAHADHLSGAPYLQSKLGGKIGIGEHIRTVQDVFGKIFNEGTEFQRDGSQFDRLFKDGDTYQIGSMTAAVMHTPGHTPACTVHVIGNATFTGDTLFMPDGGTARADFPGGDARVLFHSIRRVLQLPADMRLFMCHDYGPGGREIKWETTVAEERAHNIHVRDSVTEDQFVAMREARDKTLGMPKLIVPSIQVNIRAGHLPEPDQSGRRFLKVPLNGL
jgi:glyoxylase-like metal-dependent hydrolase (beta-lactamase superfamily II)